MASAQKLMNNKTKLPISNTKLLLTITICTFFGMYILAMLIWGGGFLNPQQFLDIFNNNAFLIVVACGLTIVMITGGIDISVGGTVALITMSTVVFMEDKGGSVFGTLLIALGIGLLIGLVQGFLVSYLNIQPFIVTLAGMFFTRGMTTIVSAVPRTAKNEAFVKLEEFRLTIPGLGTYARNGNYIPARIELGVIIALLIVLLLWAMLKYTRFGRNLYAIGGNSESALMLGINVKLTKFFAYVLCGLLAGIAGFIYLLHTGAGNASNATQAEMQAIASSIIGGTLLSGGVGSVVGTLFGVMTLKTINNVVVASGLREPYWQSITTGLMLCFFILLQSVILSYRKKKLGNMAS
ncbi:MAG: sugar ABC transporter permease YjfF [Spirochaetaceae bacterium]|nr:sugar ABC transporter permease YjfF [Spirochaetaceae bacterium]MBO4705108.1 sugar ABC transporter permease YjfF [Spirochaetaceae bacterium]